MDLYFLNFKRMIVVINAEKIRETILSMVKEQEVDVNIKFVDSYSRAAQLIIESEFDPYDHICLSLSKSNSKLKDFIEFLAPLQEKNPKFIMEYSRDQQLSFL